MIEVARLVGGPLNGRELLCTNAAQPPLLIRIPVCYSPPTVLTYAQAVGPLNAPSRADDGRLLYRWQPPA